MRAPLERRQISLVDFLRRRARVGRRHHAIGRGFDVPKVNSAGGPPCSRGAFRCQHDRMNYQNEDVDQPARHQRWDYLSCPSPSYTCFIGGLSAATAVAASPSSRIELFHGSGSRSVRDATYLGVAFRIAVNGLSVWFGQNA